MPGAVRPRGHPVSAVQVLRVDPDHIGDSATVDAQSRTVDTLEGVGVLVIVRVVRRIGRPAPQGGLLSGHVLFGTGEQSAGRDPRPGEPVIVGSAVKRCVLGRLTRGLEVLDQGPLNSGRALRHPGRALTIVGCSRLIAVVGEVTGVRRTNHVEVQIQRNVFERFDVE